MWASVKMEHLEQEEQMTWAEWDFEAIRDLEDTFEYNCDVFDKQKACYSDTTVGEYIANKFDRLRQCMVHCQLTLPCLPVAT